MLDRDAMAGSWAIVRAGLASRTRRPRPRIRPAFRLETLEGRALLSVAPPAPPTIFVVDQPGDAGSGSGQSGDIRYAIKQADQQSGDSVIVFAPNLFGQTIDLNSGPLLIHKPSGNLTILGPGVRDLTISGGGQFGVFQVAAISHATIAGLTITGGFDSQGAGIENYGQLNLVDLTITGNDATEMGGGGVNNTLYGQLTIDQSTISGNLSNLGNGGGIANSGILTINASTISGNTVSLASGGGIANTGMMTIGESTIANNQSLMRFAGGIYNDSTLTLADDTISANTSRFSGGGLTNIAPLGRVSMNNTIVDGNLAQTDASTNDILDSRDPVGILLTGSHDLVGAGNLGLLASTLVNPNPMLGSLADNGGPTQTMALEPGSPALNAGDPTLLPAGIISDQRGMPYRRVVGGQIDIGSYQVQSVRYGRSSIAKDHPTTLPVLPPVIGLTVSPELTPHSQRGSWTFGG